VVLTSRPGRVAAEITVDLPRPRPARLTGDPRAADIEAAVRESLAAAHAPELAAWAPQDEAVA